jgi:hypothetical protein
VITGYLSALSSFYRYCAAHDLVDRIPTAGWRAGGGPGLHRQRIAEEPPHLPDVLRDDDGRAELRGITAFLTGLVARRAARLPPAAAPRQVGPRRRCGGRRSARCGVEEHRIFQSRVATELGPGCLTLRLEPVAHLWASSEDVEALWRPRRHESALLPCTRTALEEPSRRWLGFYLRWKTWTMCGVSARMCGASAW